MKRIFLLLPILLIAITAAASAQLVESYPQAAFTARCWRTEEGNEYDSWMLFRVTRDYFVWEATSFDVTHSTVDVALTFTDTIYPLTWNTDVVLYLNPYMEQVGGKIRRTWQGERLVGYGAWAFYDTYDSYYDITSTWMLDVWYREMEQVLPFPGQSYPMRIWPSPDVRTNIGYCIDYDAMQYEYTIPIALGGGDLPSAGPLPPQVYPDTGYPYPGAYPPPPPFD
jgi:hypothetical protein